jgi:hypothetical protein
MGVKGSTVILLKFTCTSSVCHPHIKHHIKLIRYHINVIIFNTIQSVSSSQQLPLQAASYCIGYSAALPSITSADTRYYLSCETNNRLLSAKFV